MALCALLALGGRGNDDIALLAALGGMLALILVGTQDLGPLFLRLLTVVEASAWAAGVALTGAQNSPLLPYLLAPAFAGGLMLGLEGALLPIGSAAVTALATAPFAVSEAAFGELVRSVGQWVVIALLVGLLASWVQRLQERLPGDENYRHAYRLMAQLRAVARRLPAGLDRLAVADALLREVRGIVPQAVGGAVLVRSHEQRLTLLSRSGTYPEDHHVDQATDQILDEAWTSQRVVVESSRAVLPIVAGDRTRGLLVLTLTKPRLRPDDVVAAIEVVKDGALRLETAMLFDELREVAIVEERRRLAREIHDGIAQDLAGFGYALDGLVHEVRTSASADDVADQLLQIRADLGRLIVDLL